MLWTVVLEKTLERPLDSKEMQPVHPKGNQSWVFFGRTDAETPILWPPDAKNWLIWKDPDAGKDWRQEEKGMTEDEMVGWHHWLDGHEFGQAPGVGDGQGSLAHWSPGVAESRMQLSNWTEDCFFFLLIICTIWWFILLNPHLCIAPPTSLSSQVSTSLLSVCVSLLLFLLHSLVCCIF